MTMPSVLSESMEMKGEVHGHLEKSIRPYIDLIDTLRSVDIERDLALPTIVVIGDQSSGKSSVLEALSGVALPRGTGIVTRCPLELRLKKVTRGVKWKAVLSYRDKKTEFVDSSLVGNHIEKAQNELAGEGVGICDELITLEVMSPDVCDLTLIDLPGIARVPVRGQPEDIENKIKRLIMKFIKKQETINMVVVPCNIDIATTDALKMAQEVDPEGKRTLAILTKPDLIDKGTEKNILDIVQNKVIPLSKGYVIVKCRGQQQIDENIPLEEATQIERDFFQNHKIFRCLLTEDKATIECLATKLTNHLVDHIKKSLPQLNEQIKKQQCDLRNELKEYEAGPPQDPKGARQFLTETIIGFNYHMKSIASGELLTEENFFVQLRAEYKKWNDHLNYTKKSFPKSAERAIADCLNYRGRELLGFINYKKFEDVLQKHVATLKDPAIDLLNTIKGIIIKQFTNEVNQCFQKYPVLLKITTDKIHNIQSIQQEKAEQRISEQFEMENIVYIQDTIYLKALNEISEEATQMGRDFFQNHDYFRYLMAKNQATIKCLATKVTHHLVDHIKKFHVKTFSNKEEKFSDNEEMSSDNEETFSNKEENISDNEEMSSDNKEKNSEEQLKVFTSMYSEMLLAYYEVVVQRMADQLPMMISHFMLKKTAELLSKDMLSLLEGANVSQLLFEDSDVSKKRRDLQARLDRLSIGQKKISSFI